LIVVHLTGSQDRLTVIGPSRVDVDRWHSPT
jgi:hypothetical protein